jgi:hypothetical protein
MTVDRFMPGLPKHAGDFRFAWFFSFVLAAIAAPFVLIFKENAPWVIAVPFILGVVVILMYEFTAAFRANRDEDLLVKIPEGFSGLMSYEHLLTLEVTPKSKVPKGQLSLFPNFKEITPTNAVRVITDKETGKELVVVNCDRFSALLVTYLLDNLDKATERSLRAGLARFGKLEKSGQMDIQIFVHDATIREAIQSDFRGNLLTLVSKGGEKVVKDILKALATRLDEEKENEELLK